MKPVEKQTLIDRFTQRMDLDRIFLFSYPSLDDNQQHLLLVVNPVKGLAPKSLAPIVSLCFSDMDTLPFDMVTTGEWQTQLKHGNLLIDWSGITGRKVLDFAYPSNQMEEVHMYFILNPESIWWQEVTKSLSNTSQTFYRDKAKEIISFFESLCGDVLEELKGKVDGTKDSISVR